MNTIFVLQSWMEVISTTAVVMIAGLFTFTYLALNVWPHMKAKYDASRRPIFPEPSPKPENDDDEGDDANR